MNWTFSILSSTEDKDFLAHSVTVNLCLILPGGEVFALFFHAFNQTADVSADRHSSFHEPFLTEVWLKDDITS